MSALAECVLELMETGLGTIQYTLKPDDGFALKDTLPPNPFSDVTVVTPFIRHWTPA